MSRYIVDASIVAKWFIPEEHSEQASSLLQEKHDLFCPAWMLAEVANVLWKIHRRGLLHAKDAQEILHTLQFRMPLTLYPVENLIEPALEMAMGLGITVYDSVYVTLALSTEGTLVTADQALYRAVQQSSFAHFCMFVTDISTETS